MLLLDPQDCGPRRPTTSLRARAAGSVRRTSSIDTHWPDGLGGDQVLRCDARDLVTRPDGTVLVLDEVEFTLEVDAGTRRIESATDGGPDLAAAVVGLTLGAGFRRALKERAPELVASGSATHLLLDDLPGAQLVSGYALLRAGQLPPVDPDAFVARAGLCAGWVVDGTMMRAVDRHRTIPTPDGPWAPDLAAADPHGLHALAPLTPVSTRRLRMIDLRPDGPSAIDLGAQFRDSHRGADEPEIVLHEYTVAATMNGPVIDAITPEARVLPWAECPAALASAQRVIGHRVGELRDRVRHGSHGPSACTHLDDTLRHLADADALRPHLRREAD